MPIFVQLVTFFSGWGKFDDKKDSRRLNEVLKELQDNGAKIIDVKPSIAGMFPGVGSAVYVLTYEAATPLEL